MDIYDRSYKDYHNRFNNLYEMLEATEKKFGSKNAIIDDFEEVTYTELKRRTDAVADIFKNKYSLKRGDQIAFVMVNTSAIVVAFYAAMKLGCTCIMINTKLRETQIYEQLEPLEPKLIVSDKMWEEKIEMAVDRLHIPVLVADTFRSMHFDTAQTAAKDEPCDSEKCRPHSETCESEATKEDTAVIMYTSGTTGKPKGIMVSQNNIMEATFGYVEVQGLTDKDIAIMTVPLFHILGLSCVTTMVIYLGATEILSSFYDPDDVIAKINKYRPTHFHSVPTIHLQIIDSRNPAKDLTSIRTGILGGALVSPEDMDRVEAQMPNAVLRRAYGMTETAGSGTLSHEHKGLPKAVPNVYMRVVDENHNDVPVGKIGEIVFGGPCIARNRWHLPSLPDDMEYSGDVGYMTEDGGIFLIDRVKDIISRGGEKIFPLEIETEILKFPGIEKAAVFAIGHDIYGEVPYAAIIPEKGNEINLDELKAFMKKKVATYEMPTGFDIVKDFPITHNGKVRKSELRKITEEKLGIKANNTGKEIGGGNQ